MNKKIKKEKNAAFISEVKGIGVLSKNHGHPNVDQIYNNLRKKIPTLSKTTVTIHSLHYVKHI